MLNFLNDNVNFRVVSRLMVGALWLSSFWVADVAAEEPTFAERVWNSLEKAETKLNQDLPKPLTTELWVQKVEVDRAHKLVIYQGVIKNRKIANWSEARIQRVQVRARQNTIKHLCGKPASQKFLRLLSLAGGQVRYQFFIEEKTQSNTELFHFNVAYQDCSGSAEKKLII